MEDAARVFCDVRWLMARCEKLPPHETVAEGEWLVRELEAAGGDGGGGASAVKLATRCLEQSLGAVVSDHRQLPSQIVGRLADWDYATMPLVEKLVAGARGWSFEDGVRWWCPATRCLAWPGGALRKVLRGHGGEVNSVAISPGGTRIASGSSDWTVRVWDAVTGEPALGGPLEWHRGYVTSVAWSPDGTMIASGSADMTVRVWDAATGEPALGGPLEHGGTVTSVAWSPDGTMIASGSFDKTVRVWDAATGETSSVERYEEASQDFKRDDLGVEEALCSIEEDEFLCFRVDHNESKSTAACSPPVYSPVSQDDDQFDAAPSNAGEPLILLPAPLWHGDTVNSVAWSPDGTRIVSGSRDKTVRVWDAATGEPALGGPLQGHSAYVTSVAWSPDGTTIVSEDDDEQVLEWNAATGEQVPGDPGLPQPTQQGAPSAMPLECRGAVVIVPTAGGGAGGASEGIAFTCESGAREAMWMSVAPTKRNNAGQPHSGVACMADGHSVVVLHLIGEDEDEDGEGMEGKA
jgi:WD40 repeat protein